MAYFRQEGDLISAPFGTNEIECGQLVTVDSAGNAKSAETGAKPFLGVAEDSTGRALNGVVRIWATGVFDLDIDSAAATDLGKNVAIAGATKVTTTTGSNTVIGKIVEVIDSTHVKVKLS